jgi:DNA-binding transcriptional regulator YiaG
MTPEELRAIRKRMALPQHALATKLDITPGALSHYETGRRSINGALSIAMRALLEQHVRAEIEKKPNLKMIGRWRIREG